MSVENLIEKYPKDRWILDASKEGQENISLMLDAMYRDSDTTEAVRGKLPNGGFVIGGLTFNQALDERQVIFELNKNACVYWGYFFGIKNRFVLACDDISKKTN
jgi:hypothetical protein